MMSFKNNTGFTIIEVLMALGIAASIMTSIYILQAGSLAAVLRFSTHYERINLGKNFLFDTRRKREEAKNPPNYKLEKKEENPETYLRYSFGKAQESSFKNLENLFIEKVDILHDARQKQPSATLFTLVYMPEAQ